MRSVGIVVVLAAMFAVGCADAKSSPSSALGVAPSEVVMSAADNSCPHDTPGAFRVDVLGSRVDFAWVSVPNITSYQVEIDRYDSINIYVRADVVMTHNPTGTEWYGASDSHYRARLRTRTACGTMGVWSSYVEFSIDGKKIIPTPPPQPPDDSCTSTPTAMLPETPVCVENEGTECPPAPPRCGSQNER